MPDATEPHHQAFIVAADGTQTELAGESLLIRLVNGQTLEIALDAPPFAPGLLVYGGRMPPMIDEDDSEPDGQNKEAKEAALAEFSSKTRRLAIFPGAANMIALDVLPEFDQLEDQTEGI